MIKFVVFICGAIVMSFEILGSRVLAPNFGSSVFVWGSLISVNALIMGQGVLLVTLAIPLYFMNLSCGFGQTGPAGVMSDTK